MVIAQEVEHRGIRATAVKDVARKYGEPARAHGVHEVALAAKRLGHGGHARQQRLVLEQRAKCYRRRIE